MSGAVYPACSIKRVRRTAADIRVIKGAIYDALRVGHPMTLRQVFYRLVARRGIDKTEAEYDNTVGRLVKEMRLAGELPWHWVTDNTRGQRKPATYGSLESALQATATFYRREIWDTQPCFVEVWLEKDALSGVVFPVTARWHVPLMVTRGYPSLSFMYESAAALRGLGRPVHVAYLGDWDPSGVDIPKNVERRLREFATDIDLHFERLAVNPDQVDEYDLLTRPTKTTDSRARGFEGESVEVDAIEPVTLRGLVDGFIERYVDQAQLRHLRVAEESEREIIRSLPAYARQLQREASQP